MTDLSDWPEPVRHAAQRLLDAVNDAVSGCCFVGVHMNKPSCGCADRHARRIDTRAKVWADTMAVHFYPDRERTL